MEKIVLDGRRMTDRVRAHAYLKASLSLPDYYGGNLDALWDCLGDMPPTDIELRNVSELLAALGGYGCKLLGVFYDAAEERRGLTFSVRPEGLL